MIAALDYPTDLINIKLPVQLQQLLHFGATYIHTFHSVAI